MLKTCVTLLTLSLLTSLAAAQSLPGPREHYRMLSVLPESTIKASYDEARMVRYHGRAYAIFETVTAPKGHFMCAYGAGIATDLGARPGEYELETSFICGKKETFEDAQGSFEIKLPPCPRENNCGLPALGVGNLRVLPNSRLAFRAYPSRISVRVFGEFGAKF